MSTVRLGGNRDLCFTVPEGTPGPTGGLPAAGKVNVVDSSAVERGSSSLNQVVDALVQQEVAASQGQAQPLSAEEAQLLAASANREAFY